MAGVKISALPAVPSALLTDFLPVVQGGVTSQETLAQIATLFNANLTFLPIAGGTLTGVLNMGTHNITNVVDPVNAQDAATKHYVDLVAQGITVQQACRVATTGALTVTYSNGTAGVGATLTNAGAQAALAIDGVTLSVADRVLVKNQASTFENGIYTVTNVGSGATNWVMTRATDYDQPAEINPGDLVVINAGTANANSSWLETATVTTIGTDPITFSQFTGQAAAKAVTDNTKSTVASVTGAFTAGHIVTAADTAGTIQDGGATTQFASSTLTSAHIFVGNGSNVATDVAMSGDVGISNTGATTIQNGAVSAAKIAANGGAGIPVQVVNAQITAPVSVLTSTPVAVTGLSVTITPTASTSKILLMAAVSFGVATTDNGFLRFFNGTSAIGVGTSVSSRSACTSNADSQSADQAVTSTMMWLDSPATTSAVTYSVQAWTNGGAQSFINASTADTDNTSSPRSVSSIVAMEIK